MPNTKDSIPDVLLRVTIPFELLNIDLIDSDFRRIYNADTNNTTAAESTGSLARHIYVLGAYKHKLNPFWSIEPSLLLKTKRKG